MEILSNFASIYCYISFVIGAMFMLAILSIAAMGKVKEPRNKVHFYVARDKNGELWLYMGKPERGNSVFFRSLSQGCCISHHNFKLFGLNENDYANLKWKDEPIDVFVNLKD